jgi:uncharacterized surface protein with fasciclin (FAS1) repeats
MPPFRLIVSAAVAAIVPFAALAQEASPAPPGSAMSSPPAPSLPPSPNLVPYGSMTATLKASTEFTILSKALEATQMSDVLAKTPGLTFFAPTDSAFKALPPAELHALLDPKNVATLQQVLTYHLVNLDLPTSKFKGAKGPVQSVEKGNLMLDGSGAVPRVNDADIIQPDVKAANGTIQVVDKVLIPGDVNLPTANADTGSASPTGR